MLRKFHFFVCPIIPLITLRNNSLWSERPFLGGEGGGDPGPFSWIHTVFLVRKKCITLGYVNWSLFWFINSISLSVSLLIHSGDHSRRLQTSSPIGGYAKKQSDVWLCYSVSRIASLATRNEGSLPQATIRQSGKYHSILGGASCKRDFCILLCSLRELKMQRIRCNFKRSGCIARSNRAKSKGYCLLEFKENYGIFRIGQFRSSFDR